MPALPGEGAPVGRRFGEIRSLTDLLVSGECAHGVHAPSARLECVAGVRPRVHARTACPECVLGVRAGNACSVPSPSALRCRSPGVVRAWTIRRTGEQDTWKLDEVLVVRGTSQ